MKLMKLISTLVIPPQPLEKPFFYLTTLSSSLHHPTLLTQIAKEMGIDSTSTFVYEDLTNAGCTIIITMTHDTLYCYLSDEFTLYQLEIMKRLRKFISAFPILDISPWSRKDLHIYNKPGVSQETIINNLYNALIEYQKNSKRLQCKK